MRFVFFDCETGGLAPKTCAITQIAAVVAQVFSDGSVETGSWLNLLVRPADGLLVTLEALLIQGRTLEQLKDHPFSELQALEELAGFLKFLAPDLPCYAWYAPFDTQFLDAAFTRSLGLPTTGGGDLQQRLAPVLPRNVRDARTLALLLIDQGKLPKLGTLSAVAQHFGLVQAEPHDALTDAILGAQVVGKLLQMIQGEGLR